MAKKILVITHSKSSIKGDNPFTVTPKLLLIILRRLGLTASVFEYESTKRYTLINYINTVKTLLQYDILYIVIDGSCKLDKFTLLKIFKPTLKIIWEIHGPAEELLWWDNSFRGKLKILARNIFRRVCAYFVNSAVCLSSVLEEYSNNKLHISNNFIIPSYINFHEINRYGKQAHKDSLAMETLTPSPIFRIIWGGSAYYKWHALNQIDRIAKWIYKRDKTILFIIVGEKKWHWINSPNILSIDSIPLKQYLYLVKKSHICLALYQKADEFNTRHFAHYFSPRKIVEYMALGKPVIATNIGNDIPNLIKHKTNGFLVNQNFVQIGSLILKIKRDKNLAAYIGKNAENTIKKYRDLKSVSPVYKKMLLSL